MSLRFIVPPVKATLPKRIEVDPLTRVLSTSKKAASILGCSPWAFGTAIVYCGLNTYSLAMAGKIELTLIDRQGCHLCEEANADLARIVGEMNIRFPNLEYSIQTLDVDSDAALLAKYSDEVPVLLLNGKQIAFHRINADRVLNAIEEML